MIELSEAKSILGNNLIGPDELKTIDILGLNVPFEINRIPFSKDYLLEKKNDYYLILEPKSLEMVIP